jgi:nitroreductase
MELTDAIRQRRMIRSFAPDPVDPDVVDRLLAHALRGPSAGNTQGVAWLVLAGEATATYWEHATTAAWRSRSTRFPGLSRAPVVALALCSPQAYVQRYGEPDKRGNDPEPSEPDLGSGVASWPVPYWFGDAAFSTMTLLLGVVDAGLGAAFLGNFRGEAQVLENLGVPEHWRLFGAVLIGRPDGLDHRSASLSRAPEQGAGAVHWSRW